MPNCIVLTDAETADGFRLAGVEVLVSRGGEETTRLVEKVMAKRECGLLLMKEELMDLMYGYLTNLIFYGTYQKLV